MQKGKRKRKKAQMTEFLTEWQISSFGQKSWPFGGSGLY